MSPGVSIEPGGFAIGEFRCEVSGHGVLRVNIQNDHGKAKPYQVRQVIVAIDKKEAQ